MEIKKIISQSSLLFCIALVLSLVHYEIDPHRPLLTRTSLLKEEIDLKEALLLNPLWVDSRSDNDYFQEHIPHALPLNEDHWEDQLPIIFNAWNGTQNIVVYCSSQSCHTSKVIADQMRSAGFLNVYVLHGGWESWKLNGR